MIKAEKSILRVLNDNTLFTYLDEELRAEFKIPSTNNRIEGGVNACLSEMDASYVSLLTLMLDPSASLTDEIARGGLKWFFGGDICTHQNRFLHHNAYKQEY